ncbi:MAG: bifunctional phosphopantothenoylcysteine decarboxylase/phosphopantothenate synthase [Acidimicrobiia bacterium]|nr:bifunctional phosphopantothenoylcysteine decarboxylase/phosphopantothenate synthase [Acidimicrobiia bacterium]
MSKTNLPLKEVLYGRKIVLCVTASISAYKSVSILRKLRKLGAFVSVATTPSTKRFIGSPTFSALASEAVFDDLWTNRGSIAHTTLGKSADLILVAPASASIVSKIANGTCDEIVSAILLATPKDTPILLAPAMHEEMYENFATKENIKKLEENGYNFIGPDIGELAGGDIGKGRLSDEEVIVEKVIQLLNDRPLKKFETPETLITGFPHVYDAESNVKTLGSIKRKILITAGGTREPIDPVRVITNRSSGKMGHCLAEAALISGYEVILVTTSNLDSSLDILRINVDTADQMNEQVMKYLQVCDVVIMAAAVGDVKPKNYSATKLKRESGITNIEVEDNIDIAGEILKNKKKNTKLVCFAAETNNAIDNAKNKALKKLPDVMVLNDVSRDDSGFNSSTNKIWIGLKPEYDFVEYETMPKEEVAFSILGAIN